MNDPMQIPAAAPRWRPATATVAAILAGVMLTTAMPPLPGTSALVVPALAILFHVLRAAPNPGRLAFFFGLSHVAPLLGWLFYLDPAKSIPTRALVPVQAIAAILFVSAYYLVLGLAVGMVRRRMGERYVLTVLPVFWLSLELWRGAGELGFPWCLSGAAWLDTPLQPLYAAAGEVGLGAATALAAAALVAVADLIRGNARGRAHRWGLIVAAGVLWIGLWLGSRPAAIVEPLAGQRTAPLLAAAVQANVTQADKWDDAKIDSTKQPYTALTRQVVTAGADLVVWAETAVPAYLRYERHLYEWVRDLARSNETAILLGYPDALLVPGRLDAEGNRLHERYNASGLFSADGVLLWSYYKHHLVPLGEAMPFQRWLPWLGDIDVGQAEWTPGPPPSALPLPTALGEVALIPLICYEAIFSDLARRAVRRGGRVLVNITNDGWFGHPAGPAQHAALSRIRAVECGVPLVRSANNGISLICGPDGRPRAELGLHRRGVVLAEVETVARNTWYRRAGVWPVAAYLILCTLVLALLVRRDTAAGRREKA